MEAGDGQQVHQARLGEAVLQLRIDSAAAAQHQRVDQRCAGPVQRPTRLAERRCGAVHAGREPVRRPRAGNHQNAAGLVRPCLDAVSSDPRLGWTARRRPARRPASWPRPRLRTRLHRLDLHPPALDRRRLRQADGEADAARREARGAAIPIRHPGQLTARAAQHDGPGEEQRKRPPDGHGRTRAADSAQTGLQKCRRPVARPAPNPSVKNRRPRRHRGRPRISVGCAALRAAARRSEIFRSPSIMATSMAARF